MGTGCLDKMQQAAPPPPPQPFHPQQNVQQMQFQQGMVVVHAAGDQPQPKPQGCCPSLCYDRRYQMKLTTWGSIVSVFGFLAWVLFANLGLVALAVLGFFVMLIAGIVGVVGCILYCSSRHPEDEGLPQVHMVQIPAAQPQTTAMPVADPNVAVGQVTMARPHEWGPPASNDTMEVQPPVYAGATEDHSVQKLG